MSKNPTGSTWNQWDLHFHSPASYDYRGNRSTSAQQLVDELVRNGVRVVAVTDHHVLDVERIRDMRKCAGEALTILPGIELRAREHGKKPIHFIGIFSEELPLDDLYVQLIGGLELLPADIERAGGDEKVSVYLKEACPLIRKLGGVVSIHGAGKANSIEEISNEFDFQQRLKADITLQYVDFVDVGRPKNVQDYRQKVYKNLDFPPPPFLVGSDNHDIGDYQRRARCWIRAEPTFRGLLQLKNEPEDRIFLGQEPAQVRSFRENTRRIRSISFSRQEESGADPWFDGQVIPFSPGLVAVIGNQGSGKSALVDSIGLLGASRNERSFSFLNNEHFRSSRGAADQFFGTLEWADDRVPVTLRLDEHVASDTGESVRYIPQRHIDDICDQVRHGDAAHFREELKRVLFSRLPEDKKRTADDLDELVELENRHLRASEDRLRASIGHEARKTQAIDKLVSLEARGRQQTVVDGVRRQIDQLKANPVNAPEPATGEQDEEAQKRLDGLKADLEKRKAELTHAVEALTKAKIRESSVTKLERTIDDWLAATRKKAIEWTESASELGIKISIAVEADLSALNQEVKRAHEEISSIDTSIDGEAGLREGVESLNSSVIEAREDLARPEREREERRQAYEAWNDAITSLIGNVDTKGTLRHEVAQLAKYGAADSDREQSLDVLLDLAKELHSIQLEKLETTKKLFAPVEALAASSLDDTEIALGFEVGLLAHRVVDRLGPMIHRGRRGGFMNVSDEKLAEVVSKVDFTVWEQVDAFLRTVWTWVTSDDGERLQIAPMLRKGHTVEQFLGLIFGLEYLSPELSLSWGGTPLDSLSPGQAGTLLLAFYLIVDDSGIPLIIDQPEGNLDNETVVRLLVECVKRAKQHRQVIIVTHNPNLAVVCDADQVIHALRTVDEDGVTISYDTGALEDPETTKRIIAVLEGTQGALDNRIGKYKVGAKTFG